MKYSDVKDFLSAKLTAAGYVKLPVFDPGPASNAQLQRKTPQGMVFITVGGGAGLDSEQLFDRPFISIRAIGKQNDYDYAEKLAQDIDRIFLTVGVGNFTMGSSKNLSLTRTGGAPSLLEKDSADRYAFTCSYIAETQTGL